MSSKEERDIESVIRNFFLALDTQNLDLMRRVVGRKEGMIHIGTDAVKFGVDGRSYAKQQQSNSRTLSIIKQISGISILILRTAVT